ncbi:MAG: hypothetical protein HND39_02660 [Ignavibacteriota bacterium]|jgi:hypothetical protein|uniref:hypothetical protein n=1 Tax=Ignavibacterium album TaxID=591197 RepID=UPI00159A8A14|nr:hypothetical protein [Ignavibacteriota bacterium]NUM62083.1 hypothetical protein [Ignavibacteriaceae bacterium]QKJ95257.1 MAG: hypothetical protein HND39_02660 [Ignavibacteriota bacterium]GIK59664.1 MAG: hypothetical protein BroJett017_05540 [Ignavibacteriota bacterium]GJQ40597.1 MAG: hypothetical protein JETCAE03_00950 [Ignavibacteriaceae bacterium]
MKILIQYYIILILFVSFLFVTESTFAQEKENSNSFGISALVQDSQFDILFPIFLSESAVLAPALGFIYASEIGSDISLGLVGRFYLTKKVVRPFLGGRAGSIFFSPASSDDGGADPESTTDFLVGFLAGGEYFLNESFSFGVEAQLNATISDENSSRFGNPGGTNINTGAAVFATVYF